MEGQFHIDTVHVFVALDHDGTEGVPAIFLDGMWMPLIAADARRFEQLRPLAQQLADARGIAIKLVRFSTREELEEFRPRAVDSVDKPQTTG